MSPVWWLGLAIFALGTGRKGGHPVDLGVAMAWCSFVARALLNPEADATGSLLGTFVFGLVVGLIGHVLRRRAKGLREHRWHMMFLLIAVVAGTGLGHVGELWLRPFMLD